MNISSNCIAKNVRTFCSKIGNDSLLVQGAGGNVSWKDGDTLWVKASGTWLVEANTKEIFTPVNLSNLRMEITKKNFSTTPELIGKSNLRPSIETLLHALMPHKVVVHLHAIEILAHLVKLNALEKIKKTVGNSVKWIYAPYYKPGADLASAIFEELAKKPDSQVIFLESHGIVIGGSNVEEITSTLQILTLKLQAKPAQALTETLPSKRASDFLKRGYMPCSDKEVSLLASKEDMINRVLHDWALYPDHVVFLGAKPVTLDQDFELSELDQATVSEPPFIFAIGDGVYESINVTAAQKSQLRCYYDVVARQEPHEKLSTLSNQQISELINWDAEKYRKSSNDKKDNTNERN